MTESSIDSPEFLRRSKSETVLKHTNKHYTGAVISGYGFRQVCKDSDKESARVMHRQNRLQDDHGRRHQKWWLVDDVGHEHLAVSGEEREPRDGHYNYTAEKPFSLIRPLHCQNQARVTSYLEEVSVPLLAYCALLASTPPLICLHCHGILAELKT